MRWPRGPEDFESLADESLAKAREVEQVATYDRTVQQAFREVSDALAGREYLAQQIATLERARAAQVEIARIARARYREGVADYLEVLDAERNLFSAEQQFVDNVPFLISTPPSPPAMPVISCTSLPMHWS